MRLGASERQVINISISEGFERPLDAEQLICSASTDD